MVSGACIGGFEVAKYYFNTKTGQVVKGGLFSWWNKMGPYDTPQDAARALDIARERTQTWDEQSEEFEDDDG